MKTLGAIIDKEGQVILSKPLQAEEVRRALVTILDEPPSEMLESALLSEAALSDWSRSEEDEAWAHLQ